jgi:hypothetical protein
MDKTCFKCGEIQPIESFYKHPMMADGHLGKCKTCTKKDVRAYYRANPQGHRAYEKRREQTPERKAQKIEAQRRHRAKHSVQSKARSITQHALNAGLLVPAPCVGCATTERIEAHHEDYYKPLEVVWLCFSCHRKKHGQAILTNVPDVYGSPDT